MTTPQIKTWTGQFGADYTERGKFENKQAFNALYIGRYGVSRDAINEKWLGTLPRDARILEIGCNIGNQLNALQRLGFKNLYGIDVQRYAVEQSKETYSNLDIIVGSAFDIPFQDGFFDLVFTNNVLIHMSPETLPNVLAEMFRVTSDLIWGFEYYSPEFTEIHYRDHDNLLWKADYANLFVEKFPNKLNLEKEKIYDCLDEPGNQDKCYLLRKVQSGEPA